MPDCEYPEGGCEFYQEAVQLLVRIKELEGAVRFVLEEFDDGKGPTYAWFDRMRAALAPAPKEKEGNR